MRETPWRPREEPGTDMPYAAGPQPISRRKRAAADLPNWNGRYNTSEPVRCPACGFGYLARDMENHWLAAHPSLPTPRHKRPDETDDFVLWDGSVTGGRGELELVRCSACTVIGTRRVMSQHWSASHPSMTMPLAGAGPDLPLWDGSETAGMGALQLVRCSVCRNICARDHMIQHWEQEHPRVPMPESTEPHSTTVEEHTPMMTLNQELEMLRSLVAAIRKGSPVFVADHAKALGINPADLPAPDDRTWIELKVSFHRSSDLREGEVRDWLQRAWRSNLPCGLAEDDKSLTIEEVFIERNLPRVPK